MYINLIQKGHQPSSWFSVVVWFLSRSQSCWYIQTQWWPAAVGQGYTGMQTYKRQSQCVNSPLCLHIHVFTSKFPSTVSILHVHVYIYHHTFWLNPSIAGASHSLECLSLMPNITETIKKLTKHSFIHINVQELSLKVVRLWLYNLSDNQHLHPAFLSIFQFSIHFKFIGYYKFLIKCKEFIA